MKKSIIPLIALCFSIFVLGIVACNSSDKPTQKVSAYKAPDVVQKQKEMQTSFAVADYKGWISDYENIYTADQNVILTSMITNYEKKTGVEIAILTVPSYESDISDYAVTTFKKWGIGKKGINNGMLLVISKANHKFFACTGYGLEGYLPDGWLKLTEQDCLPAHFKAGEYFEGTKEFLFACMAHIGDAYSADTNKQKVSETPAPSEGSGNILLWLIIGGVVLIVIIIIVVAAAGSGGSGSGSGGGFFSSDSGSGFFSGGGGDSGSFGGFGGGDSGGGGAGGSW